jgi:hypothetical protein
MHVWAAALLPTDIDEPGYIQFARDYARALKSGDLNAIVDYPGNREHPALVKLLYGFGILALGPNATEQAALLTARAVSVVFGALAVALVAVSAGPLAGGLLALHTLAVKYTAQAYLEALPHLASIATVFAFRRARGGRSGSFWFSAILLGLTAAGKLTYVPVIVVVICYLAIFESDRPWPWLLPYFAVALTTFFLLDPTLWHDPLTRLADTLFFYTRYTHSADVARYHYPWYQPFVWIFMSVGHIWHPTVFFYFGLDGPIAILAGLGLRREWRERRWLVVWLGSGLLFLLLWPTKWPQYALTIVPPVCLVAAATLTDFYQRARATLSRYRFPAKFE